MKTGKNWLFDYEKRVNKIGDVDDDEDVDIGTKRERKLAKRMPTDERDSQM